MELDELELLKEARLQLESSDEQLIRLKDDTIICECMCISLGFIRESFNNKEFNLQDLRRELGIGSGCGKCLKSFEQWKTKI
ncbi:MAG: (2Fe-2S)-binding protein [Halobacteriovoraceae bacterium]|nr:(2Fe-2S)-binding protein [Halobacteriovoraceae bacterium]